MKISHHPDVATLMSCAAGSQPESFAAVMAAHISMCPQCASELRHMEEIGTALFENLPPAEVNCKAPVVAARAAEANDVSCPEAPAKGDVPLPLVPLIGNNLSEVAWHRVSPGVWQHRIGLSGGARGELRLLKVAPGIGVPDHGHNGTELTLLLEGSYHDKLGTYRKGDLADVDEGIEHEPVADAKDGCICLIATDGKARFKSVLARLVQPFVGM